MGTTVSIVVNGENREAKSGSTVCDLLLALQLDSDRVAIERNLEILRRTDWPQTVVESGDRYEIVQLVGGG
jgi:thiamine biosynthesis protein ThiS